MLRVTGRDSPVMSASSISLVPRSTMASAGTHSPGRIDRLANARPLTAERLVDYPAGEAASTIRADRLVLGDVISIRPGSCVPADALIVRGTTEIDEALMTGESAPVDKASGDKLFAGTVNMNGQLLMRVTAIGETTALAHIIAAVQRAQGSRANIQRLGDQVSSVFVPVVVVIALAAGLWWGLMPEAAH